jgi:hypothetical protein
MSRFHYKKWLTVFFILLAPGIFFIHAVYAGTLSCSVTSTCNSPNVVIFKMYATANSHSELPGQSNYSNLVCCGGVAGLGNACTGTYAVALNLAKVTNSHVEENTFSDYTNPACIQAPSGGTVSVAYASGTCLGYDTTVASMVNATNSHVGNGSAYPLKVCASAAPQATVGCATNVSSTSFSSLTSSAIAQASPNVSTTMSCTNTASGCTLYVKDAGSGANPGLWRSATPTYLIPSPNAAFSVTSTLVIGTEGYGIQVSTDTAGSGGTLALAPRYLQTGNVVGGFLLSSIVVASSTADVTNREVIVTHLAAISASTPAGSYADTVTYSCAAN